MSYLGSSASLYDPTRNSPKTAQTFSGDGSTTTFTLQYSVAQSTDIQVMVENVVQQPDYAYSATGTVLAFTGAPKVGTNNIYVVYNRTAGLTGTVPDGSITSSKLATNIRLLATDQYSGNGVATQFALSDTPADANSLIVSVNGVEQAAPRNYTVSGSTITFTSAPASGANVVIRNVGFRTTQTLVALSSGTPIVQPAITGGTINLASSISTTGNVSVYDYTGTQLKAGIGPNYVLTSNPFFLNSNTVSSNISIPSGYNAFAIGPLTQAGNVVISVPAGSKYIIF
jgi:hypothetical protein